MKWMTWVFFVGLLWISPGTSGCHADSGSHWHPKYRDCWKLKTHFVVPDNFYGIIKRQTHLNQTGTGYIVFLPKTGTAQKEIPKEFHQMEMKDNASLLYISKWHIDKELYLYVLQGRQCKATAADLSGSTCNSNYSNTELCQIRCFYTKTICENSIYREDYCSDKAPQVSDKYMINLTTTNEECLNCNNPVKEPEEELHEDFLRHQYNITIEIEEGEDIDAVQAAGVMKKMSSLATSINGSSASLAMGEGVTGILVRETDPEDVGEVSFAYASQNGSINIVENRESLTPFSRSVTVSKEAFLKAISLNITVPFAALLRFTNLAKDERNSTVLNNEVLAVEMGTVINNLTDKISVNFREMTYKGIPSCHSWDGEGSRPNWTDDGCLTIQNGDNITCQCSHLTFFAILLTPLNETISSSDLNNLTIITQVGCGLSVFFLSIVLFMHFLMRRTKASKSTRILIHLVSAMFLLNLTFLINNFVAKLKSSMGCKIIAALMHYFMLATFTWFAVQAFHLCLQLHVGGKIGIRHYMLKVSITSWVLPSVAGIVLLSIGKYGEQAIQPDDTEESVAMCWITDSDIHFIVNIGYYVLVFFFTFTTFIITLSWLFCLKKTNAGNPQMSRSGKSIVTILGLCCLLGITWGFAFFAYGVLRIPSYYIFTVLNSFQGFFLFIYYYNISPSGETNGGENAHKNFNTSSISTLKTGLDSLKNPYSDLPGKK